MELTYMVHLKSRTGAPGKIPTGDEVAYAVAEQLCGEDEAYEDEEFFVTAERVS